MKTIEEMKVEIMKKAKAEYDFFLDEISGIKQKEVILKAYEIVMKEEILNVLEHGILEESMDLRVLNALNYPLSTIYHEWLDKDSSLMEDLVDTIHQTAIKYCDNLDSEDTRNGEGDDVDEEMEV